MTDEFTDRFVDANTDGIGPSVICRSHILPTEIPTDLAISKVCENAPLNLSYYRRTAKKMEGF